MSAERVFAHIRAHFGEPARTIKAAGAIDGDVRLHVIERPCGLRAERTPASSSCSARHTDVVFDALDRVLDAGGVTAPYPTAFRKWRT